MRLNEVKKSYKRSFRVGVVGATGIVGQELLAILSQNRIPLAEVRAFASESSVGESLSMGEETIDVLALADGCFDGLDIVFFGSSNDVSKQWVPKAQQAGAIAIDKSSCFRMDADVPLVVCGVNTGEIAKGLASRIVASPNCTATPLTQALFALSKVQKLKRVVVSSYQAVSGAGKKGVEELEQQTRDLFNLREVTMNVFSERIAFNVHACIPASGGFDALGYTDEESKVRDETRRILQAPDLPISATCVRVPVFNGHSLSVNVELEGKITADEAREALAKGEGLIVIDDQSSLLFPTPAAASGEDYTLVGRIRADTSVTNGIALWISSDNLRTGAALNAVRIAEVLCSEYLS